MASLLISLPGGNGDAYGLSGEKITVGRLHDNDIQINDPSVSSHHAEFTLRGGAYQLTDLDSTNGTYVDGELVEQADLAPRTHIRFGEVDAVFCGATGEESRPMPELESVPVMSMTQDLHRVDFSNAFQFKPKRKNVDKTGAIIMGFAIFSIIVCLGAFAVMLMVEVPQ